MNYRTRPAEHICSLEDLFINYLGLDIPIVPQTSSYSNKHTFSQLFLHRIRINAMTLTKFCLFLCSRTPHLKN